MVYKAKSLRDVVSGAEKKEPTIHLEDDAEDVSWFFGGTTLPDTHEGGFFTDLSHKGHHVFGPAGLLIGPVMKVLDFGTNKLNRMDRELHLRHQRRMLAQHPKLGDLLEDYDYKFYASKPSELTRK